MTQLLMAGGTSAEAIRRQEEAHLEQSSVNVGETERWASGLAGGALVGLGIKRGTFGGLALALMGGGLLYRALTGHCDAYQALGLDTSDAGAATKGRRHHKGVKVVKSFTINRTAQECYDAWRDLASLPRFMSHLESVTVLDATHSRWTAHAPLGRTVTWNAEIINDRPGELIAWRSTAESSEIQNAGTVRFRRAPGGRGTEVTVELNYEPPAGRLGAAFAWLLGEEPDHQVREDLRHFKQLMETGEIPTVAGQSTCRANRK